MVFKIFILALLFSANSYALWTEAESKYYKSKYLKKQINEPKQISFVSEATMDSFKKKYGKDALRRLIYINDAIKSLDGASTYKKISTIDKLVNRIHFIPDIKHWKKENYWATPLETIGTNYGDTEDMSLLKYVLMVKVGINPRDLQLIKKEIPYVKNNKKYDENLSLFYFTKKHIYPFVIDYKFRGGKIYKYSNQFKYKYVKASPNKHWNVIFNKNIKSSDVENITKLSLDNKKRLKDDVHIFY